MDPSNDNSIIKSEIRVGPTTTKDPIANIGSKPNNLTQIVLDSAIFKSTGHH